MKVLKTKDYLARLIDSKTKEMLELEKEIEALKQEQSSLKSLDAKDKLSKRLVKFESHIKSLISHINKFNAKHSSQIFDLLIEESHLSIIDVESGKKLSNFPISGANDLAVDRWLDDQSELLDFYLKVVTYYRSCLTDSSNTRLTLKFNHKLIFFLSKAFEDVEITVNRKMTRHDVIYELNKRSHTSHEDRKYESDFWAINDEEYVLMEESTFDRPVKTIEYEIKDILELFM